MLTVNFEEKWERKISANLVDKETEFEKVKVSYALERKQVLCIESNSA